MNIRQIYESVITEGKHWPEDYKKTALNMIKTSPLGQASWYSENYQKQDVDTIADEFGPLSHKNSNLGYFSPIIKWFIEYTGDNKQKYQEFIERKLDKIIQTLLYLSNNPSEESKIKDNLKTKWKFVDFEEYADRIQSQIDTQQKEKSKNLSLQDKGYEIIKIDSYEELHEKFGGDRTGYQGESEWCHTNGKSTYNSWTSNGTKMFFVLAKKNWEKIEPPDPKETNAYDDYGTSLIAILVNVADNRLLNATLRWNHIIEPSKTVQGTSVDKAFLGWADLAEVTGRNVEKEISEMISAKREKFEKRIKAANKKVGNILTNLSEITKDTLDKKLKKLVTEIVIPNSVTSIGNKAFQGCSELVSITIPNSVTSIEDYTFSSCSRLTSITIPNSVTSIENGVFFNCSELTSITIPNSVTSIGSSAFSNCTSLTDITIPNSVTSIGSWAFFNCSKLISITIHNSVTSIGGFAFFGCSRLTSITIPNSVTSIGEDAFLRCYELTSIIIPNSVTSIGNGAFNYCNSNIIVTVPKDFNRSLLKNAGLPSTAKFRIID